MQLDDPRVAQLRHDVDFVLELVDHVAILDDFLGDDLHGVEDARLTGLHLDHFAVSACMIGVYLCRGSCPPRSRSAWQVSAAPRNRFVFRARVPVSVSPTYSGALAFFIKKL